MELERREVFDHLQATPGNREVRSRGESHISASGEAGCLQMQAEKISFMQEIDRIPEVDRAYRENDGMLRRDPERGAGRAAHARRVLEMVRGARARGRDLVVGTPVEYSIGVGHMRQTSIGVAYTR